MRANPLSICIIARQTPHYPKIIPSKQARLWYGDGSSRNTRRSHLGYVAAMLFPCGDGRVYNKAVVYSFLSGHGKRNVDGVLQRTREENNAGRIK